MGKTAFTMFEMLIVAVLMVLIAALVLPRMGEMPRRFEVESALTDIRRSVNEVSMRARSTGTPLMLTLDLDESLFEVSQIDEIDTPVKEWVPAIQKNEEAAKFSALAVEAKKSYQLSKSIEWLPAETGLDAFDSISYSFFEDGQAAGKPLRFSIAGRQFQMDVDKLTGDPLIQEFE